MSLVEQKQKDSSVEGNSLEQEEDSSVVATLAAAAVNLHRDVNNITLNHTWQNISVLTRHISMSETSEYNE